MEKENQLTRQEKIDLLNKVLGTEICFLCGWKCGAMKDREKSTEETILALCARCYDRYQILKGLEKKCECGCEKCKC